MALIDYRWALNRINILQILMLHVTIILLEQRTATINSPHIFLLVLHFQELLFPQIHL